jgi:hypothetical protein
MSARVLRGRCRVPPPSRSNASLPEVRYKESEDTTSPMFIIEINGNEEERGVQWPEIGSNIWAQTLAGNLYCFNTGAHLYGVRFLMSGLPVPLR